MKIGIYDSGIGGLSVLHQARKMLRTQNSFIMRTKNTYLMEKKQEKRSKDM